ncbi:class I SAM-dependent methyltransferase [Myxococcota bacterium]|nr:class I SAM-dependent methyltransferase [Myxococcota bacterium]
MKQHAPAAERNRDPILAVLRRVLPARPGALVLEVASGSGQHAVHFAAALPHLRWQPSDQDPVARDSVAAWRAEAGLDNLLPPLSLDVRGPWPVQAADAIFCANMIHISPWDCTLALLSGAAAVLPPGSPLVLYGPYRRGGAHTAPSNAAFDASLRARDPSWGVRDLEAVVAQARGFALDEVVEMPANNLTVVLRRG